MIAGPSRKKYATEEERKAADKASFARYRARNLEKIREKNRLRARETYAERAARRTPEQKAKAKLYSAAYYRANKDSYQVHMKRHKLATYGLTIETFDALLVAQDHKCAICRSALEGGKRTHVDHDHKSGAVRGVLCSTCNMGIGLLSDDPTVLIRAALYIKRGGAP